MVKNSWRGAREQKLTEQDSKKSEKKKKKSSGHGSASKGDCESGLTASIPFVPPKKVDDSDETLTVDITIKKNPSKRHTKDNTEKKYFSDIEK
jgi:hypothetical protein